MGGLFAPTPDRVNAVAEPTKERIAEAFKEAMESAVNFLADKPYDAEALKLHFREEVEKIIETARENWNVATHMGLSMSGYAGFVAELRGAAQRAAKRSLK